MLNGIAADTDWTDYWTISLDVFFTGVTILSINMLSFRNDVLRSSPNLQLSKCLEQSLPFSKLNVTHVGNVADSSNEDSVRWRDYFVSRHNGSVYFISLF